MARHHSIGSPPAFREPPALKPGQARRWLVPVGNETREDALARAKREQPWGKAAIGIPTRGRRHWTFTITLEAA